MKYLIIEKYKSGKVVELYNRFSEKGRQLPSGVVYINSWINEEISVCYQIMESESKDLIVEWTKKWDDLAEFEIIPVISSEEAKNVVCT